MAALQAMNNCAVGCDESSSPAMTSALSVRRLTNGAGQKSHRAVVKGVVGGQRQSPAQPENNSYLFVVTA